MDLIMARHDLEDARRTSPLPGTAPTSVQAPASAPSHERAPLSEPTAGSAAMATAHAHFGNGLIGASLGGADLGGLGPMLAGDVTYGLAGIGPAGAGPGASNVVRALALRDFEATDFDQDHPSLRSLRPSGGEQLPEPIRARFERAMGHEFGHVRVHRDGLAATQSSAMNAHAFTIENHIWFGSGEWAPGTPKGDRLLAHELTHVKQHDEGRIRPQGSGLSVSSPSDPLEREAYGNEDRVAAALPAADQNIREEQSPQAIGVSPATADRAAQAAAGGSVPSPVADKLERSFGHDFANARAPFESPSAVADRAFGEQAAALGAGAFTALRDGQVETPTSSSEEQEVKLDKAEMTLGPVKITVEIEGDALVQRVEIHEQLVPGLDITTAEITYNDLWEIESATLGGTLTIGELVQEIDVELSVGEGGEINATIEGVQIPMPGDLFQAAVDLQITPEGVGCEATFTFDQIEVAEGYDLTEGELIFTIEPGSDEASLEGTVKGTIADSLHFELTCSLDSNQLTGELSATIEEPVDLGYEIKLTGGNLSGDFHREEGAEITGGLDFDLAGWASAELSATVVLPGAEGGESEAGQVDGPTGPEAEPSPTAHESSLDAGEESGQDSGQDSGDSDAAGLTLPSVGTWSIDGTVTQDRDYTIDEDITLTGAQATISIVENELVSVGVPTATIDLPDGFRATLTDGTYDIAEGEFSGEVEVNLEEPLELHEELTLTTMNAIGTLEANELKQITGSFAAELNIEDAPRFILTVDDFFYDFDEEDLSCVGTVTLDEEFELFSEGDYTLWLTPETSASATIEENELTKISGDLKLALRENDEPFISADINADYPLVEGEEISGTATARLDQERMIGDHVLLTELEASADLAEGNFNIHSGLLVAYLDREGLPRFRISLEDIAYNVQEGDLSGVGTVSLDEDHELETPSPFSIYLYAAETELSGMVEESAVTLVEGQVGMMLRDQGEDFIKADIVAEYPLTEGGTLSGEATATLVAEREIATVAGETLVLTEGSNLSAVVEDNALARVTGELSVSVREGEDEWAVATIDGTYELGEENAGYTGEATLKVTGEKHLADAGPYEIHIQGGESAPEATAVFEENKLVRAGGSLPFTLVEDGEAVIGGNLSGTYLVEEREFTGSGSLYLLKDIDIEVGGGITLRVLTGTGGTVTVSSNDVGTIEGVLNAEILIGEEREFTFAGRGRYNVLTDTLEEGTGRATLVRTLTPFGEGVLEVSDLSAEGTIEDNALTEITGGATIRLPSLNDSHGSFEVTYRKEGDRDRISGSGDIHLVVIPESDGRGAQGDVTFDFDGTERFNAEGELRYSLTEAVSGTIGVKMDQEIDPEISGTLKVDSELIPAADIFRKKLDILPEQSIDFAAGPVPLTLKFGASAGFGLGVQALVLSSEIAIRGWKPLTDATSVPEFDATANLDWGMDFDAMAAAWMSLGIGVSLLSAGGGLRGEARLAVPIDLGAEVNLHGANDEFWGDIGISLGLSAGLSFHLIPFLYANIFSARFEEDLPGWDWDMGELVNFEWGATYEFGDREGERPQGAAEVPTGSATQEQTEHTEAPDIAPTQTTPPPKKQGGPDLSGVSSLLGESEEGEGSELAQRLEQVQTIAEGIAAIGYLVEQIGDLLTWAVLAGPIGLAIRLVYKMIIGEITWTKISEAVENAIAGIRAAYDLISPYLPDWWQTLSNLIDRGINLFDEWWNGDTRMHQAVQRGEHLHAGAEMKGEMADRMLDMWAQESHKHSVLTILESGDHSSVVSKVGWGKLKGKMTNILTSRSVENRFQRWCVTVGYGRWVQKTGFFGGSYTEFEYTRR